MIPNWISNVVARKRITRRLRELTRHSSVSYVALNVLVCETCESEDFNETKDQAAVFDPYSIFTFVPL